MAASTASTPLRRSARNVKKEEEDVSTQPEPNLKGIKREPESRPATPNTKKKRVKLEASPTVKTELPLQQDDTPRKTPKSTLDKAAELQARKLKSYASYSNKSPFPDFLHPTPEECALAHRILAGLHGERKRPQNVVAPTDRAGCGDSPSVLDALVRTILSQNTSDKNSTRAKRSMDEVYGGSDKWAAIVEGGQGKLQKAIQSGGLSVVKSKVIIRVLEQVYEKYGTYSLDHLFNASDEDAMREMLSFQGVGPKTASCVLLFCLRRESFAVDTHVYRLTGLLGWRPDKATREEAQAHLDACVPDDEKYPLHVLLISHGKRCDECKAGGKNLGKCELRKAFRKGRIKGEAGEEVKEEELAKIKKEGEDAAL
ncbi:putative DNA glycosylase [Paramyrothecium foliicola]|nr:putative DNA glycosylase [Paramyrothecium foliicola]